MPSSVDMRVDICWDVGLGVNIERRGGLLSFLEWPLRWCGLLFSCAGSLDRRDGMYSSIDSWYVDLDSDVRRLYLSLRSLIFSRL